MEKKGHRRKLWSIVCTCVYAHNTVYRLWRLKAHAFLFRGPLLQIHVFLFAKAALFKTQSSSAASRRLSLCMFLKSESESESESECDYSSASKAGDLEQLTFTPLSKKVDRPTPGWKNPSLLVFVLSQGSDGPRCSASVWMTLTSSQ